jgi:hypothetical protein
MGRGDGEWKVERGDWKMEIGKVEGGKWKGNATP